MAADVEIEGIEFLKGHGTQNDFVLLPDADARLDLTADLVVALCDRRRGIGADGVLRVARADALCVTGALDELPVGVGTRDWFMDYRNADGSVAEMCGNGVRVFAHHLVAAGLVDGPDFVVGSRAGARAVHVTDADVTTATVTVEMGPVTVGVESKATLGDLTVAGVAVDVGNPHLACVVPDLDLAALDAIDLASGARFDTDVFPAGVNIEIITPPRKGAVAMRVLERGVGETRSCGTGTVAAAAAALLASTGNQWGSIDVDVPGGRVTVRLEADAAYLTGPSVLVGSGVLRPGWDRASTPPRAAAR
ncbi:diaminopimelate epimerase [Williamsia sp. MIQD14]|uniref:diaminopimelate epimerase n=1 Tax=Williamsia sp. MIQD14 TaxID=3425703 RepID=UPI003DA0D88D